MFMVYIITSAILLAGTLTWLFVNFDDNLEIYRYSISEGWNLADTSARRNFQRDNNCCGFENRLDRPEDHDSVVYCPVNAGK